VGRLVNVPQQPPSAQAIFLLPAGLRFDDRDATIEFPPPRWFDVPTDGGGFARFELMHLHHAGECDGLTRALYVLGGRYLPFGYQAEPQHDPDEVHDQ
jgi:hypothetical protein